jgi:SAM-dependent methyltransferase
MSITDFDYNPDVYNTVSATQIVPILIDQFNPSSVIDVGCGNAAWLKVFTDHGIIDVLGVDGDWVLKDELKIPVERFLTFNIEQALDLHRKFDLALCLETAEHLDEHFAPVLIKTLVDHSDVIVFSAAVPGQPGDRHINLKEPAYWSKLFRDYGYHTYDMIRPLIWDNEDIHWWYRQNVFVACKGVLEGMMDEEIPLRLHPGFIQLKKELERIQKVEQENSAKQPSLFKKLMTRLFK